jgi:uncharacterized membrane protein YqaE (UPF0057 family)
MSYLLLWNTKITLLTVPVLALISMALLQGCATSSDVISDRGIQKRKYRSGFYVSNRNVTSVTEVRKSEPALIQPIDRKDAQSVGPSPTHAEIEPQTALVSTTTSESTQTHLRSAKRTTDDSRMHNYAKSMLSQAVLVAAHPAVQAENQNTLNVILAEEQNSKDEVELLLMIILCFLLPPLAVFLLHGISTQFWISVLLTILFWVPGIIYALYLTLTAY